MFPNRQSKVLTHKQSGSMLVISIFVIVVMSLLGLAMIRMLSGTADAGVHEVYGLRALNAAQSGIEAKIAQAFPLSGASQCGDTLNHDFGNLAGLESCSFVASCAKTDFVADNLEYYRFTSTGQCQIGDFITSRTVLVDAKVEL